MICAMRSEVGPIARGLGLEPCHIDGCAAAYQGYAGSIHVVAVVTTMGTKAAQRATEALFATMPIDHVMVAGVAGGVDPTLAIGQLVVPEVVIDSASGRELHPVTLPGHRASGVIATSDALHYGDEELNALLQAGITAVDMETASIGAVCEQHGCPWSAFRAISDRVQEAGHNYEAFSLANPDGTPDMSAVAWFVLRRPWRVPHLVRLGRGAHRAITQAAEATIVACVRFEVS
ncbi:MAG: hypothetical protein N2037_05355 [Acidimicrobiales bacterium]|nr:hypothetical protein [Acidimicrobiales bacterium]